jgi:hypothetical protein
MKKLILFTLFFVLSLYCFSQDNNVTYRKYELTGTGYINIPSTLELQSGDYKNMKESAYKSMGYELSKDRVVFQTKGLNTQRGLTDISYEKIIFESVKGSYGDYEKLTSKIVVTKEELIEIGNGYKKYKLDPWMSYPSKLISYDGASIVVVNGQYAIKVSYLRQLSDNEPCYVEAYLFQNNDRAHYLTIVYRKSQASIWEPVFNNVLNSFTITNIR